jgi:hypothetical protein
VHAVDGLVAQAVGYLDETIAVAAAQRLAPIRPDIFLGHHERLARARQIVESRRDPLRRHRLSDQIVDAGADQALNLVAAGQADQRDDVEKRVAAELEMADALHRLAEAQAGQFDVAQ